MAGATQQGREVYVAAGMLGSHLGAAAVRRDAFRGIRLGLSDSGEFVQLVGPAAGRGEELFAQVLPGGPGLAHHDNSGTLGHQLVGMPPDGLGAVNVDSGEFTRPVAGHSDELVLRALRDNLGPLHGNPGMVGERGAELGGGLLPGGLGAVCDNSGDPAPPDALGTLAEHLQRIPPVAGIVASSAAVTGVAAGTASPAAGFGFFALLLGGLALIMAHVRRLRA